MLLYRFTPKKTIVCCIFFCIRVSNRYRVVLFGDAGTGKTALVSQFMTSEYMHTYDASLGKFKQIFRHSILTGECIFLYIWKEKQQDNLPSFSLWQTSQLFVLLLVLFVPY